MIPPNILNELHRDLGHAEVLHGQGRDGDDMMMSRANTWFANITARALVAILSTMAEPYQPSAEAPAAVAEYEYRTTTGPRKNWDGSPDLAAGGWEEYQEWERFDYHEERYWRRPLPVAPASQPEGTE